MGRVGPRRAMFGERPQRRVPPAVLVMGLIVAVPLLSSAIRGASSPSAAAVGEEPRDEPVVAAVPEDRTAPAASRSSDEAAQPDVPPVFASYEGLALHLPSDAAVLVGFHEASQAAALPLDPVGIVQGNANTTRFEPPPDVPDGVPYVVMSSRGRVPAATSAVDVLMVDDDPVLAPVSGEVTDVREYHLYGKYRDHRIEIAPTGRPDLRLVLIHVAGVEVSVGDTVEAGRTPLARSANRFSFGSHIDRYTEPDRWPHVHLEVKRADEEPEDDGAPAD